MDYGYIRISTFLRKDGQFIPVEAFNSAIDDTDYIEGAIVLSVGDVVLLDKQLYDCVDALWAYLGEGLDQLRSNECFETYFPDLPVRKITMRRAGSHLEMTVEWTGYKRSAKAPFFPFARALVRNGIPFFERLSELAPDHRDTYAFHINQLRTVDNWLSENWPQ